MPSCPLELIITPTPFAAISPFFPRRGVRLQSRSFARWNPRLRHSPKSNRLMEIVSVYFLVLHGEHRWIRRYAGQWIICRMLRCQPSAAIIQTRGRWTTAKYLRP